MITYVVAARERDKYAAEPVTDSLKNERERERERRRQKEKDSHIRQHLTATAVSRSSFIGPHIAETVLVPKTLRVTLRTVYCSQTGLTGHASPIRVALIILGYGGLHTYRYKPSPLTLEPLKNIVKSVKEGRISFKMKTSIIFRPKIIVQHLNHYTDVKRHSAPTFFITISEEN